jgi:hypothetical protein
VWLVITVSSGVPFSGRATRTVTSTRPTPPSPPWRVAQAQVYFWRERLTWLLGTHLPLRSEHSREPEIFILILQREAKTSAQGHTASNGRAGL